MTLGGMTRQSLELVTDGVSTSCASHVACGMAGQSGCVQVDASQLPADTSMVCSEWASQGSVVVESFLRSLSSAPLQLLPSESTLRK